MTLEGRKKDILDLLYERGKVSVSELAGALFVSEMTVRRDLAEMEKGGFLRRFRGGEQACVVNDLAFRQGGRRNQQRQQQRS